MDEFVEVDEPTGCLESITQSIGKVGTGLLMVLIAFPLLFWNEGRAVKRAEDLETGRDAVVSVDPAAAVVPANQGKLLHVQGKLSVKEPALDTRFGVSADALGLTRVVEMYQWEENKKTTTEKVNGKKKKVTRYSYEKEWSEQAINSSSFRKNRGHSNPPMPFKGAAFYAQSATIGAYELSMDLKKKWPIDQAYPLNQELLANFAPLDGRTPVLNGNQIYYGDPAAPQVGDLRIHYRVGLPGAATVVAGLSGKSLVEWSTKDLNDTIGLISPGHKSAKAMFQSAEEANAILTWGLRLAGLVLMFLGFNLISGPIDAIAGIVPIFGPLVDMGTTLVSGILALALTAIVIAIGWIFYRPLIGILLLLLAVAVAGGGIYLAMRSRAK